MDTSHQRGTPGVATSLSDGIAMIWKLSANESGNKETVAHLLASLEDVASNLASGQIGPEQACSALIGLYHTYEAKLFVSAVLGPLRTLGFDLGHELGLSQDEIWGIEEAVSREG
ncbi:TPA: hypothetical protein DCF80_04175 [Candidatus Saccharibacteria bacterium]|nr:hypothetical protein [Candidatus Saccharibacteria bacterium]HRK41358.1 hypothetical protein [Candidatus Saccharibacteria bacterium]